MTGRSGTVFEGADGGDLIAALQGLGFSQYESRCYVGLLADGPATGYGLAKATGVPSPKVYETLRSLIVRGAARRISQDPDRFVATPSEVVLAHLSGELQDVIHRAEAAAEAFRAKEAPEIDGVRTRDLIGRREILAVGRSLVAGSAQRVYVSASHGELVDLEPALRAAVERGVDVIALTFGRNRWDLDGARVFRHASTEHAVYRHHRALHVALVADSQAAVNAVSLDGTTWEGAVSRSAAVVAAVKGMVKHDIDLQQIYEDFGASLVAEYGPGLQRLEAYRRVTAEQPESGRQTALG